MSYVEERRKGGAVFEISSICSRILAVDIWLGVRVETTRGLSMTAAPHGHVYVSSHHCTRLIEKEGKQLESTMLQALRSMDRIETEHMLATASLQHSYIVTRPCE